MTPQEPTVIVIDPKTGQPQPDAQPDADLPSVDQLAQVARLMDSLFQIPGTNLRIGLDSILGLIPGLGDTVTSLVSVYILQTAARMGVPRITLMRMTANVALDYVVGTVPLMGDVFDVYWKSNQKNVELLRKHTDANPKLRRKLQSSDWVFLAALIGMLLLVLIGSLTLAYLTIRFIGSLLFS